MQLIQMHLSKKKNFFSIFLSFFQINIKFWKFLDEDGPYSLCISEITDPEKRG